jgi:hypothetical protein
VPRSSPLWSCGAAAFPSLSTVYRLPSTFARFTRRLAWTGFGARTVGITLRRDVPRAAVTIMRERGGASDFRRTVGANLQQPWKHGVFQYLVVLWRGRAKKASEVRWGGVGPGPMDFFRNAGQRNAIGATKTLFHQFPRTAAQGIRFFFSRPRPLAVDPPRRGGPNGGGKGRFFMERFSLAFNHRSTGTSPDRGEEMENRWALQAGQ